MNSKYVLEDKLSKLLSLAFLLALFFAVRSVFIGGPLFFPKKKLAALVCWLALAVICWKVNDYLRQDEKILPPDFIVFDYGRQQYFHGDECLQEGNNPADCVVTEEELKKILEK